METLSNLESFVRSAEAGNFSVAARTLGLTPAAVSKNVARLEANLGVRLFQRSTRRLSLTEAGESFLREVSGGLASIQAAIANTSTMSGEPAGTVKVSLPPSLGLDYVVPLLGDFLARYPAVVPELHFENRQVDLIADGFDAAIGGGIELTPGVVARELSRVHVIPVASPAYLSRISRPKKPEDLERHDGIAMRSAQSGRLRSWTLRNRAGEQATVNLRARLILTEPEAICRCAIMGLGIALVATPAVLPHLKSRALVRLLPDWHADLGPISIYFAGQKLLPAKTRVFVDFVVDSFKRQGWAAKFSAN